MRHAPTDAPISSTGEVCGNQPCCSSSRSSGSSARPLGPPAAAGMQPMSPGVESAVEQVAQGSRAGTHDEGAGTFAHRGRDASSSHDGSAALRYDSMQAQRCAGSAIAFDPVHDPGHQRRDLRLRGRGGRTARRGAARIAGRQVAGEAGGLRGLHRGRRVLGRAAFGLRAVDPARPRSVPARRRPADSHGSRRRVSRRRLRLPRRARRVCGGVPDAAAQPALAGRRGGCTRGRVGERVALAQSEPAQRHAPAGAGVLPGHRCA